MANQAYVLEMRGIVKSFPGVRALSGAQLHVKKGEVHALIGENGAGKSTLMNILLGAIQRDEGEILLRGQSVHFRRPVEALQAGISMIHQEISLIPTVDIAENIWIGREKRFLQAGLINKSARYAATRTLLERLGIELDPRLLTRTLSVANMQLVELARAVSYNSDIIVMDEPTSSLTESEIRLLYRIIRELTAAGTSIIFISHKLEEVYEICDHITVMRDGQYICDAPAGELGREALIHHIAGREITDLFPKEEAVIGEVALEVRHLTSGTVFQDISFQVRRGEILGFSGLVGSGRTEIMRAIFGIDPADSGEVLVSGQPVRLKSPRQAIAHGLGMVTEDRLRMGIISNLPVRYNISLAYLRRICTKTGFIRFQQENADVRDKVRQLAIKLSTPQQAIGSLSGGNQQKAILAKWLLAGPKVLILDEPTRGIDVGSKSEIHRLISQLARQGLAVILVSSELPEVLGMSDRILVVRRGRIAAEVPRAEATQELLVQHAFGV